jgi:NitT/TauT family transport system ATP-binding protein
MEAVSLNCRHVSAGYPAAGGLVHALEDVTFETRAGEFLSVVGPSGCGKTTLLRALAGLIQPTHGRVERPVHVHGTHGPLIVFQEHGLFPWMTVIENAAFGLEMLGVGRRERESRSLELLHRYGFRGRERAYPHQLSLGMKQRVAVIRCFLSDPPVMLMDEPFAALDCQTRLTLQRELLELWEQNHKTVVFVTHDMDEALLLSDRVLVLSAQPGTVRAEFAVPFPRPRAAELTLEEEFLSLKRRIARELGMRTMQAACGV